MASVLVCYGTIEGQTGTVADRIATALEAGGHEPTVVDLGGADADPADFDAVLVGSSIHVGSHQSAVTGFAEANRDALAGRPTGFFQVSLSSAVDDEKRRADAAGYANDFVEATGWEPDRVGLFGGALRYSEYGFLKRWMMKRIAKGATGDTDTSRDYEYTDWEEVEAFANDFAAFVEGRLGVAPPDTKT
ncbi:MAG: flavodoxin domain-containing protein [Haloarculaceae archaeon]